MMDTRHILIVDDNQGEIEILTEAIEEVYPGLDITAVLSGDDCLQYLRKMGDWQEAARPDLILLDLNMPGTDGRSILAKVKSDPQLCHIPVIIFTNSSSERDILHSHRLYANSYVTKPLHYEDLKILIRNLLYYWLEVARIPG